MFEQLSTASAMSRSACRVSSRRARCRRSSRPDGSIGALSFYDTAPLKATLEELVDFDLINSKQAAALARRGQRCAPATRCISTTARCAVGPEHVMASGALPPGFPPVEIDGELYWDGGIVSNSPLTYVADEDYRMSALIFQVDVFSAAGGLPQNLAQVAGAREGHPVCEQDALQHRPHEADRVAARRARRRARKAAGKACTPIPTSKR